MSKRIGQRTVELPNRPGIVSWASVAGQKEKDGPYGGQFDYVIKDELNGEDSFEAAERSILEQAVKLCAQHAQCTLQDVQMLLAGDLLNQIISAGFAARNLGVPFYGLYGACSTMSESLSIGSMLADGGFADRLICATCSHFCTAERQYRMPLELGNQRPPTAQWTVTGAGGAFISYMGGGNGKKMAQKTPAITMATFGKVVDFGITDVNNMGAAMSPSCAHTLLTHLQETGRNADYYDLIVTGDLGALGSRILKDLTWEKGVDIAENHVDCGEIIYNVIEDEFQGGSGAGCSAVVFNSYIYDKLKRGRLRRVLFLATGALLSTVSSGQGESIPCIAHAVSVERTDL